MTVDAKQKKAGVAYREPWFWLVMAPLILVVLICSLLLTAAFLGSDQRVIDNYYKEGRMINNRFEAEQNAQAMDIHGHLHFDFSSAEVFAEWQGNVSPEAFQLVFSHPMDAEKDKILVLRRVAPGRYRADLSQPLEGRWYVILSHLETPGATPWRVTAEADFRYSSRVPFHAHL